MGLNDLKYEFVDSLVQEMDDEEKNNLLRDYLRGEFESFDESHMLDVVKMNNIDMYKKHKERK